MIFQPRQLRCIQIRQNGTTGLALPYRSFFITEIISVRYKLTRFGGGDFELTVPYSDRNVELFSHIEDVPTFIALSFSLDESWDTQTAVNTPHPMPMVAETYNEEHNLEENLHVIHVSGRGALDVLLDNKVIIPKIIYQSSDTTLEEDKGFYPWDIAVDLFGRLVNGDKTPDVLTPRPPDLLENVPYIGPSDPRYVSNVSLLHDIVPQEDDPRIEKTYDGDSLLETITNILTTNNLYISGKMYVDAFGCIHFDYMIHRLTDLTLGTDQPLVYDYGAMPPKLYNKLLSIQESRVVAYIRVKPEVDQEEGDIYTVTKGTQEDNAKYRGWKCKELYFDGSSLPFGDSTDANFIKMVQYVAADELYKEGNTLINVEDIEYLYTPLKYYVNCWPGCIYTSIGPTGIQSKMVIVSFVLTGSKQDGWLITPELAHYTDPYTYPTPNEGQEE